MSFEDYLEWEYEGGLTEWVDGEGIIHMPATLEHQRIVDFLQALLTLFVRLYRLGSVHSAPYPMRARPGGNAREPDLFFLASAHRERLTRTHLNGPADLAIEVFSGDSVSRDRITKFHEYEQAGVREYWMIDSRPEHQQADFVVLDETGSYQPVEPANGIYHATVLPGFWLNIAWLWQETPDPLASLSEIAGADQLIAALQNALRPTETWTERNI